MSTGRDKFGRFLPKSTSTHGKSGTKEYKLWLNIKTRCNNPNTPYWDKYGGRGIKVCPKWDLSFEAFLADMGKIPPGLTLDRIDVNGDYEPENCRWATAKQQGRNKRDNRIVNFQGESMTLADAIDRSDFLCPPNTIISRLSRGWSLERALSQPIQQRRTNRVQKG